MIARKLALTTKLSPQECERRLRAASAPWRQVALLSPSRRPVRVSWAGDSGGAFAFELFSLFNAAWAHGSISRTSGGSRVVVTLTVQWVSWLVLLIVVIVFGFSAIATSTWSLVVGLVAIILLGVVAVWFEHRVMQAFLVDVLAAHPQRP